MTRLELHLKDKIKTKIIIIIKMTRVIPQKFLEKINKDASQLRSFSTSIGTKKLKAAKSKIKAKDV